MQKEKKIITQSAVQILLKKITEFWKFTENPQSTEGLDRVHTFSKMIQPSASLHNIFFGKLYSDLSAASVNLLIDTAVAVLAKIN